LDARATFDWPATYRRLAELAAEHRLVADERGRGFIARDSEGAVVARFESPRLLPALGRDVDRYLSDADTPGRHVVLLVQAGATAIGLWEDDDLLAHKVISKYVVRGKGRAQPTHLATKGKSRYGSRLRLRNARAQLVQTNEKLLEYQERFGTPRLVHFSAPVRTWPELFRVEPGPPFGQRDALLLKIPLDVHVPDFEELKRVRSRLARGLVTRTEG